jgi:spore coat protein E
MPNYKEIVTKAVLGKGKKTFVNTNSVTVTNNPTTVLGCWVINHNFRGYKENDKIVVEGSYDVNIWYSRENDTITEVVKQTDTYLEKVNVTKKEESDSLASEEIIVRSLKNPTCTKVEIKDGVINYTIEKELGIEIVGDTKIKININQEADHWDEIDDSFEEQIDKEVNENYLGDEN